MTTMTWEEFRRFHAFTDDEPDNFWGCVSASGKWFDSSVHYETCIHWCCYFHNETELSQKQEREWFDTKGRELGLSIIHGKTIKRMYEAGLIT